MPKPKNVTLYSQRIGPFPQAAMITLLEKGAQPGRDFRVENVDLSNPAQAFLDLSPTGKPPLLDIDGTAIFETSVIIEAIDELFPPYDLFRFDDALLRAKNRSWVQFGLQLLSQVFEALMARDETAYTRALQVAQRSLAELEACLGEGPYFNGNRLSLIDFVYATFFLRQALFDEQFHMNLMGPFPKLSQWSEVLLARPSTRASLPEDFETSLLGWLSSSESYIANRQF